MRKYRKWVLTLGLLATPWTAMAGPFDFLKSSPAPQQPAARPDNQQVAEQIADVLRKARLNGSDIEISFQGGVARISGNVGDASQKAKATYLVSRVPGVERVDNQLGVAESARESLVANPFSPAPFGPAHEAGGPGPSGLPAIQPAQATGAASPRPAESGDTNQAVAERIKKALGKERLNGFDIEIRFRDGTAMLSGFVKDADQRTRAEKAVAAVPGVERVENRLLVQGHLPWAAEHAGMMPPGTMPPGMMPPGMMPPGMMPPGMGPTQPPIHAVNYQPLPPNGPPPPPNGIIPPGEVVPGMPVPGVVYGHPGAGTAHPIYNMPYMPDYAWPATAQYPNSAGVQYPTQYSASAWPYIGPFYPYPQVPLGWRQAQLEWDDGHWYLNFRPRTDRWWWFMNPKNW